VVRRVDVVDHRLAGSAGQCVKSGRCTALRRMITRKIAAPSIPVIQPKRRPICRPITTCSGVGDAVSETCESRCATVAIHPPSRSPATNSPARNHPGDGRPARIPNSSHLAPKKNMIVAPTTIPLRACHEIRVRPLLIVRNRNELFCRLHRHPIGNFVKLPRILTRPQIFASAAVAGEK